MARQETGEWKSYNVKYIVSNVESVFKNRDINKLSQGAYQFIDLHMGFIAHYNLYGFRNSYEDLEKFARKLQTSEYSNDYDYNLNWASAQLARPDRQRDYSLAYLESIAQAIRGIVAVARKYYPGRGTTRMFDTDDYRARSVYSVGSRQTPARRSTRAGLRTIR